jgi:hypothetical protein
VRKHSVTVVGNCTGATCSYCVTGEHKQPLQQSPKQSHIHSIAPLLFPDASPIIGGEHQPYACDRAIYIQYSAGSCQLSKSMPCIANLAVTSPACQHKAWHSTVDLKAKFGPIAAGHSWQRMPCTARWRPAVPYLCAFQRQYIHDIHGTSRRRWNRHIDSRSAGTPSVYAYSSCCGVACCVTGRHDRRRCSCHLRHRRLSHRCLSRRRTSTS